MNATNLVQRARSIKYDSVLAYLELAFKDFPYAVYLFGSYATGRFHGHSDVDILIIVPDAQSAEAYRHACNKMAGLGMNYDILTSPSIERLDCSIAASLQAIHDPLQQRPPSAPRYRHQTGLTLIEIMIALLIGAFLLGGVLQIFINSKQTYRMQEGLSRLQENGRFAMEFLSNDIRMADHKECLDLGFAIPLPAIEGTNNTGLNTSDTVTIRRSTGACSPPAAAAPVTSTIVYSIQTGAGGGAALFKKIDAAAAQELVEGIENMQILYGEDLQLANPCPTSPPAPVGCGTPDYYVTANNVVDKAKVVSIRISLLVVTLDNNLTAQPVAYTYNGTTTTPTDNKIRRVFNTTIALRNRLQ